MKVLHVIPSLDARDGGPSIALPMMVRGLTMHGIEVDVVATITHEDATHQNIPFGSFVEYQGCRVCFFPRQTGFYKASLPLLIWLWQNVKNYDLVHNHALFSFAPLAGAYIARWHNIPYLIRPLGVLNIWGMENRRPWLKKWSFALLDKPALDHAAAIHYTTYAEQQEDSRLSLQGKPVVVPLGIDLAPYMDLPSPSVFKKKHPSVKDKKIILFVSRLDPKKGLELLLDAFAQLVKNNDNIILVIAGSGETSYVQSLKLRASDLCVDNLILWTGHLNHEEKLEALAAADLFVLPSYSENFGMALLEALTAGCACIASENVALAQDPNLQHALKMIPCEVEELEQTCRDLLADPQQCFMLGKNAAAVVKARYSILETGRELAMAYRKIHCSIIPG